MTYYLYPNQRGMLKLLGGVHDGMVFYSGFLVGWEERLCSNLRASGTQAQES